MLHRNKAEDLAWNKLMHLFEYHWREAFLYWDIYLSALGRIIDLSMFDYLGHQRLLIVIRTRDKLHPFSLVHDAWKISNGRAWMSHPGTQVDLHWCLHRISMHMSICLHYWLNEECLSNTPASLPHTGSSPFVFRLAELLNCQLLQQLKRKNLINVPHGLTRLWENTYTCNALRRPYRA